VSFRDTIRVIQPGRRRLKIFVDFWNVVINARKVAKNIDVDVQWDNLVNQILAETSGGYSDETSGDLAGCYIFGSYAKSAPEEKAFIDRTLDTFGDKQGLYFEFKERVKKESSDQCKNCGHAISKTTELGVDVLLTVEMIKHAAMREHEYLALVSSDRDYIPLLGYLKDQGQRVLHAATDEPHREMRSLTWKQVALKTMYDRLVTLYPRECVILTTPTMSSKLEEVEAVLSEQKIAYRIIDVSNRSEMHDKDLRLFVKNRHVFVRMASDPKKNTTQSWTQLFSTLDEFRAALRDGSVGAQFPYLIRNGVCEAHYDQSYGWIVGGRGGTADIWNKLRKIPETSS